MKKTKIKFEDIKAGDLIEVVKTEYGVKNSHTGVVFECEKDFGAPGMDAWKTVQDGILAVSNNGETIYRIDVAEAKFEDIREGDRIRVTTETESGRMNIVEDTVVTLVNGMNSFWLNKEPDTVVFEKHWEGDGTKRTIEILERDGE